MMKRARNILIQQLAREVLDCHDFNK